MKNILTICLFLVSTMIFAQVDTVLIYNNGIIEFKRAVTDMDSLVVKIAPTGSFTDSRDNSTYSYITYGNQVWMTNNLRYLPQVDASTAGSEDAGYSFSKFYYVYNYVPAGATEPEQVTAAKATANYSNYGVLYNMKAATDGCPAGWHLPTADEWTALSNYLINNGYGWGGSGPNIAKAMASVNLWASSATAGSPGLDPSSNNASGFNYIPGGLRYGDSFGSFGTSGRYWTSTVSTSSGYHTTTSITKTSTGFSISLEEDTRGLSIRCVRN